MIAIIDDRHDELLAFFRKSYRAYKKSRKNRRTFSRATAFYKRSCPGQAYLIQEDRVVPAPFYVAPDWKLGTVECLCEGCDPLTGRVLKAVPF